MDVLMELLRIVCGAGNESSSIMYKNFRFMKIKIIRFIERVPTNHVVSVAGCLNPFG
jgi:hypothetical protein